ncbi:hypothetical protein AB0F03_36285 [Streptomyces sp. NPDC028722]
MARWDPAARPVAVPLHHVALAPVSVSVALPADHGLLFGSPTLADYQLTVHSAGREPAPYMEELSQDGTTLVFCDADLQLPGTTAMWVAVSADHNARRGATSLAFTVGGKPSPSATTPHRPSPSPRVATR